MYCSSIVVLCILLCSCSTREADQFLLNLTDPYELINPIDGNMVGHVTFNETGYVRTRSETISHPDGQSTLNLVIKTIGQYTVSDDRLFLGDRMHSGAWLYDRWGGEKERYSGLMQEVLERHPLPDCITVVVSGDKLLIQ